MLMLLALVILVSSVILLQLGSLPIGPATVLVSLSLALIFYELFLRLQIWLRVRKIMETEKVKWAGICRHQAGLAVYEDQEMSLAITRQDVLELKAIEFELRLPLKRLKALQVLRMDRFLSMNEQRLALLLGLPKQQSFQFLRRCLKKKSRRFSRSLLLLTPEDRGPQESPVIALELCLDPLQVKAFLARPEIHAKITSVPSDETAKPAPSLGSLASHEDTDRPVPSTDERTSP